MLVVHHDLPSAGLSQPQQQWKKAENTLFKGGTSLPQHSLAERVAGCSHGHLKPGQGPPEILWPGATGKAITDKAAEKVKQNSLSLLLLQSHPRLKVIEPHVASGENMHSGVFFVPKEEKGL